MSQPVTGRTRFLLVLLGLVALIALYRVVFSGGPSETVVSASGDDPVGATATRPTRGRRGGRAKVDPEQLPVAELKIAALEPKSGDTAVGRNLWQFYTPPRPVPPPPPPPPVKPVVKAPPPPLPVDPGPPVVVLPTINFRYVGSFGPKRRRIAVLEDGELIINAVEGDVVQEEFVVAKIGFESIYIGYKNHPDEPAKQLEIGG